MAWGDVMVRRLVVAHLTVEQSGFTTTAAAGATAGIDGYAMAFRKFQQIDVLISPFQRAAGTAELNGECGIGVWPCWWQGISRQFY